MHGVDDPAVEAAVRAYVKLMRASRSVLARVEPFLARHGLTPTQLGVLEVILHKGPLSQRALGRKLLTSAGNMSDVIDKLARRGLVRRVADGEDRRQVRVELTAAGETLIRAVFPTHAADIFRAMSGLNATDMVRLDGLLRTLGRSAEAATGGLAELPQAPHLPPQSFDIEQSGEGEQKP